MTAEFSSVVKHILVDTFLTLHLLADLIWIFAFTSKKMIETLKKSEKEKEEVKVIIVLGEQPSLPNKLIKQPVNQNKEETTGL